MMRAMEPLARPDIAHTALPPGWRFELVRNPARPDEDRIIVTDPQALGPLTLLLKDPQALHRSFYRLALDLMAATENCGCKGAAGGTCARK